MKPRIGGTFFPGRAILAFLAALAVGPLAATSPAAGPDAPAIVPVPQKIERRDGAFELHPQTQIITDAAGRETAEFLAARLRPATGYKFKVSVNRDASGRGGILLTTRDAPARLGAEGYELTVSGDSVILRAPEAGGLFYGAQSLLQLLPPEITAAKPARGVAWTMPCVAIEDQPRFKWRGLMLDVSRHFFNKQEVEQLLDALAAYKINTFHWHLVDDHGWRIEIKKYPRLTQVGAWRKEIGFKLDPKASTAYGPDGRYGGFYTQADVRDVVAYASARHITIVPEIEMPGHSSAALMAYPQFSCTGGPFTNDLRGGVFNGIYCVGNEATYGFINDVLDEVCALFPGQYLHVGGDEVLTNNWHACAKCQARMQAEGLTRDLELESYFIRRVEKLVNAHHRSLIGWSEIREGGLAQNAAIMDWAGGAVEAAGAGHDVVMSPLEECYFDHYQSGDLAKEPHAIGGYLPLEKVYAFEPVPAALDPKFHAHILGVQANVWTEYMPSMSHVDYMIFPRACALAEIGWSPKASRDLADFKRRLQAQYPRLTGLGVNYRHASETSPLARDTERVK